MNACNAEERAPVSILALIRSILNIGKATHSRQPSIGNDIELLTIFVYLDLVVVYNGTITTKESFLLANSFMLSPHVNQL